MKAKLNNSKISQLQSEAANKGNPAEGHDSQTEGLGIVLHPSGKGVWRIDYRDPISGKRRRRKIGKFPALTVVHARQVASEKFQRVALGCSSSARFGDLNRTWIGQADAQLCESIGRLLPCGGGSPSCEELSVGRG